MIVSIVLAKEAVVAREGVKVLVDEVDERRTVVYGATNCFQVLTCPLARLSGSDLNVHVGVDDDGLGLRVARVVFGAVVNALLRGAFGAFYMGTHSEFFAKPIGKLFRFDFGQKLEIHLEVFSSRGAGLPLKANVSNFVSRVNVAT